MSDDLPCGCRPGSYLCAEAERLWLAVGAAYRRSVESKAVADWTAYDRARDLYGEHVREDEP